jgi:hypothetical protein
MAAAFMLVHIVNHASSPCVTSVIHAIQEIERFRLGDESINALLEVLTFAISPNSEECRAEFRKSEWNGSMIDAIAERVIDKLIEMHRETETSEGR